VVGGAKGASSKQGLLGLEQSGAAMDAAGIDGFVGCERGQQPGQPLRKHRLASPWWAVQEQPMPTRRGDQQGSLRVFLSADLTEARDIGASCLVVVLDPGGGFDECLSAQQVAHDIAEVGGCEDLEAGRRRCLGSAVGGDEQRILAVVAQGERERECAGHGSNPAIQGELAHESTTSRGFVGDLASCHQDAYGDREIEPRSGFAQRRGGEVYGDASIREPAADGPYG
jgi:hypothetical protein